MLTVSLHDIRIFAARGMYVEEHQMHNEFLVDVDVQVQAEDVNVLPFIDYSIIKKIVTEAFEHKHDLLEHFIRDIYHELKRQFTNAEHVKIRIKKLNPPMQGEVGCSIVCFED